jgi:hypothetical protein
MKIILNIGLTLCLILTACSSKSKENVESETTPANTTEIQIPTSFYKKLRGSIGDNIKLSMDLTRRDSTLSGGYNPENDVISFNLTGQFLQSNQIELREINDKNEETGLFKGKFTSSEIFEGTWTNLKTKQTFPFKLTEEKNGIANVTYEHLRNENCNAKKKDSNKRCSYIDINMIKVSLPNVKISEQINNSIIKRILGDEYNTIKEYLNTVNVDEEFHREVDIDFIVEINEKDFICLNYRDNMNGEGSNRPMNSSSYINFDLNNGSEIKLDQLLIPNYSDKLNQIAEKMFYEAYGKEGFDFQPGEFKLNDDFAIKKGGLIFMFDSNLAPVPIYIPYNEIKDLINAESLLLKIAQK